MKRIVLFVEGEGEADAVPNLVSRLFTEQNAWDVAFVDQHPFRVGQINNLVENNYREWKRKLAASFLQPCSLPKGTWRKPPRRQGLAEQSD